MCVPYYRFSKVITRSTQLIAVAVDSFLTRHYCIGRSDVTRQVNARSNRRTVSGMLVASLLSLCVLVGTMEGTFSFDCVSLNLILVINCNKYTISLTLWYISCVPRFCPLEHLPLSRLRPTVFGGLGTSADQASEIVFTM